MEEPICTSYLKHLEYSYMEEHLEECESYSFIVEMKNETGDLRVKRCEVFYIDRNWDGPVLRERM